jgi:hypothetical protein
MRILLKRLLHLFTRPRDSDCVLSNNNVFLLMSNARSGSSYLQSTLSTLGVVGDFEFSLRPYNTPMPHQQFLSLGIDDIASKIRNSIKSEYKMIGSKLTLPIYDYLSDEEVSILFQSCRNIAYPIHLVRHYWDVLKSNLSRGVAHDFNSDGMGWDETSQMRKAYEKHSKLDLGPDKPSVFVNLSEEALRKYLTNLLRNDFVFSSIRESHNGITVNYESLQMTESFQRILDYLSVNYSNLYIKSAIQNPLLKKLPLISDSNIPYAQILQEITDSCYRYYQQDNAEIKTAKQIFDAQMKEVNSQFS